MNCDKVSKHIIQWINNYIQNASAKGFVIGISGGIDSALVSTLCAKTGHKTICVSLPIYQPSDQIDRAQKHIEWLKKNFPNISDRTIDLTNVFEILKEALPEDSKSELALANTRSRLRMTTLYSIANTQNLLVAGTGNAVEDMGIGFFTKWGDGSVDFSPIGDLLKTEVQKLSAFLGISSEVISAKPTDGLWADDRSDEDQIGASYPELEWAMGFCRAYGEIKSLSDIKDFVNQRQYEVLKIYLDRHEKSAHKMAMPPICFIPERGS